MGSLWGFFYIMRSRRRCSNHWPDRALFTRLLRPEFGFGILPFVGEHVRDDAHIRAELERKFAPPSPAVLLDPLVPRGASSDLQVSSMRLRADVRNSMYRSAIEFGATRHTKVTTKDKDFDLCVLRDRCGLALGGSSFFRTTTRFPICRAVLRTRERSQNEIP
jgi:hypothetical protein